MIFVTLYSHNFANTYDILIWQNLNTFIYYNSVIHILITNEVNLCYLTKSQFEGYVRVCHQWVHHVLAEAMMVPSYTS